MPMEIIYPQAVQAHGGYGVQRTPSLIENALQRTGGKPANGFEPMTFALQKRCSTAELSRPLKSTF